MKQRGWFLAIVSSLMILILILVLLLIFISSGNLEFQEMAALVIFCLIWIYGLKRGLQLINSARISQYKTTTIPQDEITFSFSVSFKEYMYMKVLDPHHWSFSLIFISSVFILLFINGGIKYLDAGVANVGIGIGIFIFLFITIYIQTKRIYKQTIGGETQVVLSQEGLTYIKCNLKQTLLWKDFTGILLFKKYGFLYNKNNFEFLLVTSDDKIKNAVIYYLNQ